MGLMRAVRAPSFLILIAGAIACGSQQPPAATDLNGVAALKASTTSACPGLGSLEGFLEAGNVSASFSNDVSTKTTTYTFISLTNENPVGGVPGLIKYCVYATPAAQPTDVTVAAKGADDEQWLSTNKKNSGGFSFVRPGGNSSNIPLDGATTVMGTATWSSLPTDQSILLHIADPTVCTALYGADSPGTCFVKPGAVTVCDKGDTALAYNAMPFGAENCYKPALGFEAHSVTEFGDEVTLGGSARKLVSLKVLFSSYACQSGNWNTGDCVSAAGATFDHPITANIYAVSDCSGTPCPGALLATATQTFSIPFRPTHADAATCPELPVLNPGVVAGSQWVNPLAVGAPWGTTCVNSISKVLTFDTFASVTLPDDVIWTVAFNTNTAGPNPIGSPGPYDSLNVGDVSYSGAPYAGTDVDPDGVFIDANYAPDYCGGSAGAFGLATPCWTGFRPLGAITTTP